MMLRYRFLLSALCYLILYGGANAESKDLFKYNPRAKTDPKELYTVFYDRGMLFSVLKKSIIVMPRSYESKVWKGERRGRLTDWKTFYSSNSSWLHTHEVTLDQVLGNAKIDEDVYKRLHQLNKVVIATKKNRFVTVSEKATTYNEEDK